MFIDVLDNHPSPLQQRWPWQADGDGAVSARLRHVHEQHEQGRVRADRRAWFRGAGRPIPTPGLPTTGHGRGAGSDHCRKVRSVRLSE